MKKKMVALLAAAVMLVSLLPAAFAADTMDEAAFRSAVAAGGTVTMTGDVTLTGALTIDKAVTIDGTASKYSITYNGSGAAINTQSNDVLILKNLTLNAAASGGRGVEMFGSSPVITVDGCTLNVNNRGIGTRTGAPAAGASITVTNSVIQNSQLPDGKSYDTWATVADTRGISAWNMKSAAVKVTGSTIQGFGYCINVSGNENSERIIDTENTNFTITNSHLKGWTTFNVWGARSVYNITNTELLGVNVATGGANSFATIVVNDDIYKQFDLVHAEANIFNITGGSIKNYLSNEAQSANMGEELIRIDSDGITRIVFSKNGRAKVDIQDCADCCESVLYSPVRTAAEMQDYYNSDKLSGEGNCAAVRSDGITALPFVPAL